MEGEARLTPEEEKKFHKKLEEYELLREVFRSAHPEEGVNARLPAWMRGLPIPEWEDDDNQ